MAINMSDHLDENETLERILKLANVEVPDKKPGGWTVMILNDNMTPAEVVVDAIVDVIGMSASEAYRKMMQAHEGGWAAIKSYGSKDLAETKAEALMAHARANDKYEQYRRHPHFRNFQGPWPLTAEVMEAGET